MADFADVAAAEENALEVTGLLSRLVGRLDAGDGALEDVENVDATPEVVAAIALCLGPIAVTYQLAALGLRIDHVLRDLEKRRTDKLENVLSELGK